MIEYDLIKAGMLMDLIKVIYECKDKNQTAICQQYSLLALNAANKAYDLLSKDKVT